RSTTRCGEAPLHPGGRSEASCGRPRRGPPTDRDRAAPGWPLPAVIADLVRFLFSSAGELVRRGRSSGATMTAPRGDPGYGPSAAKPTTAGYGHASASWPPSSRGVRRTARRGRRAEEKIGADTP